MHKPPTIGTLPQSFIVKKQAPRTRRKTAPRTSWWSASILIATCGVGVAHLLTLNGLTTMGIQLRQLEQARSALGEEVRALDQRVSDWSSIGMIETAAQSMEFVVADDARYFVQEADVAAADMPQRP